MKTHRQCAFAALKKMIAPCLLLGITATSQGAVILNNPASEFSTASNPNGVWSYGYSATLGGFTPISTASALYGLSAWRENFGGSSTPVVAYNGSATPITVSTFTVQPGELHMHPGPNDEFVILRYTAPDTANYFVSGSFFGQDSGFPTSTDVHLLANGTALWNGTVNGFGPSSMTNFSSTVSLSAGGYLDFVVGSGGNTYFGDSTGLFAGIEHNTVPEPSAAMLGLGALGLMLRRRRK